MNRKHLSTALEVQRERHEKGCRDAAELALKMCLRYSVTRSGRISLPRWLAEALTRPDVEQTGITEWDRRREYHRAAYSMVSHLRANKGYGVLQACELASSYLCENGLSASPETVKQWYYSWKKARAARAPSWSGELPRKMLATMRVVQAIVGDMGQRIVRLPAAPNQIEILNRVGDDIALIGELVDTVDDLFPAPGSL